MDGIDPNIALSVKPVQIQSPNDWVSNAYNMKQAQMTNQLNQMKMDEYSRDLVEQKQIKNELAQAKSHQDVVNTLTKYGKTKEAADYAYRTAETGKLGAETTNLGYTGQKTLADTAKIKAEHGAQMLRDLSQNPSNANITAHFEDIQNSPIYTEQEKLAAKARLDQVLQMPVEQRQAYLASQGATASDLKPHFVNQENVMVNGTPTTRVVQMPAFGGTAQTVAGTTGATYNKPAANVNVNMPAQEREFEKQVGKDQATMLNDSKTKAIDAAQILATNQVAKNLLDNGVITGVGAEFFTKLNQGLNQAGIDFGKGTAAANSQAYGALMATNTAKLIKNFGAGTGLSDADRQYAKQAAAGDITMDEKAIRKIIDINNKAAQNVINVHNKNVSTMESKTKTILPYAVNPEDYSAGIPEGRAGATQNPEYKKVLNKLFPKDNN
jgi:hypothetical protein